MIKKTITHHSQYLDRDMMMNVYGNKGKPCIVFPAQNGRYFDFENFKMVDAAKSFIEEGRLQLFCVDSIDLESWSLLDGDPRTRILMHEKWFNYILEEVVPYIKEVNEQASNGIMTTGCSMGASHAANFFFRRPDVFDSVIALSGYYSSDMFFNDYMDDLVYLNSPNNYIEGMTYHHPHVELYRKNKIIICTGQGAWEDEMIASTTRLKELLAYKDVPCWIDFWGYDVNHDWPWWIKQFPYFLEHILD